MRGRGIWFGSMPTNLLLVALSFFPFLWLAFQGLTILSFSVVVVAFVFVVCFAFWCGFDLCVREV